MSDNENSNKKLMPEGGSSPPTDQVQTTDAPAVDSETKDTSSAEEEEKNPQTPSTDNDKDKDESQGQETEGGEEPNENPNKENKNDYSETAKKVGESLGEKYNKMLEAKKNDNNKDSLGDQMKDLNEVQVDKAFVSDSINLLGKISFDELIGNPLRAAVKAQRDLAKETLSYIREEGIKVDENGQGQITYVTMNFIRDGKQVKMRVPLLTLMPVPRLSISTMSYTFKAKVNAMSGVVASVGSGGTPINAGISTGEGSKSAAPAKQTTDSSAKGNNETTGNKPGASTDNPAASKDNPAASKDNPAASSNNPTASAAGAKPTISTTPTMSVGYSSKKDSGATRDSRYSVETTMDISITASEGEMPRGIDRLLGVLDDSTEVIDPKGTLQVSADRISLVNNYGAISVSYRNGKGAYAPTDVTCEPIEGEAKPDMLESGDEMLLIFKAKGVYMVSAGELHRIVFVS